jgi:hypothetical protein
MTSENNGMYMPVAPMGNAYGNGNDGMFGGNWMWFLLVWMAMFGWGGNGFGFGGNGGQTGAIQRGFDQNAIMTGLQGIQNGVTNGFAQAEIAANSRQMADMNQYFQMQSAFQNCCCENRLANAQLGSTIAQDGALTRQTIAGGIQSIQDKLCQLEMDNMKQNYEGQLRALQNQLNAAQNDNQALRFAASQGAQTAKILANNEAQTTALEQYLAPVPRPAYVVQNPNCCANGFGYGGCGGYAA